MVTGRPLNWLQHFCSILTTCRAGWRDGRKTTETCRFFRELENRCYNLANVSTDVSSWLYELVYASSCHRNLSSLACKPYLVIYIELYIFWKQAYVPSWSAVVVHHSRYSGVVQCFWDPFELHSSHVVFPLQKNPAATTLPNSPYIRYLTAIKALPLRALI